MENDMSGRLNEEQRWEIICTWKQVKSIRATAKECECNKEAVQRWVERYKATGGVTPTQPTRQPFVSSEAANEALRMFSGPSEPSAREVAIGMKDNGMLSRVVSKSTIIRHAKKAAKAMNDKLQSYTGIPPKGLNAETRARRLAFARANLHTDWERVMFTDRKRFYFRYPGSIVKKNKWCLQSVRQRQRTGGIFKPSKPSCLNIYAGITRWGATHTREVAGTTGFKHNYKTKRGQGARNITTDQYVDVLQNVFLFEGKMKFGGSSWTLQQDNDPTHKIAGAVLAEWNNENEDNVQLLPNWPPNSPDLNSIEIFWNYVQEQAYKTRCHDFKSFKNCVKSLILSGSDETKEYLAKLYDSMPRRIAKVIELEGEMTDY